MPEYLIRADAMKWDTLADKTVAAYDAVASANSTPLIDYLLECNRELELAAEYLQQQRLHSMNRTVSNTLGRYVKKYKALVELYNALNQQLRVLHHEKIINCHSTSIGIFIQRCSKSAVWLYLG